jgi:hypothetical protein
LLRLFLLILLATAAGGASAESTESDPVGAWCDYLGKRLHSVSYEACRAHQFIASQERTAKGNILAYRDFDASSGEGKPAEAKRILVIGGIHGDELTSISTVFRWLEWLREPGAAVYRWRVLPVANPDGLMAKPSTRVNAHGVDLNRNFQTPGWEKDADKYWVKKTGRDPRRYPGKTAGSEVETRWLQTQIEDYRPDLIVSIHAPYNLLDYDGPVPKPLRFGRLTLNRLGVYPGSLGNYCGLFKQIPVITIELPNATSMPNDKDQAAMWQDMLDWMKHYIQNNGK